MTVTVKGRTRLFKTVLVNLARGRTVRRVQYHAQCVVRGAGGVSHSGAGPLARRQAGMSSNDAMVTWVWLIAIIVAVVGVCKGVMSLAAWAS